MPSHGRLRWILLLGTLWQSFFSTGIVYGWAGLLLMLKDDGVYARLCPSQDDSETVVASPLEASGPAAADICSARSVALNLIFSCGAVTAQASGVVVGSVLDCFGPCKTIMLGNTLVIAGSVLFAETPGSDADVWTLPLAFALFGFGGNMIHLSGFSLANLFPASRRPTLAATFVMTFTLSGFTFQLMLLLNAHGGLSMQTLFRMLALLQAVHLLISATQWPSLPLQPGDQLVVRSWRVAVVPAPSAIAGASAPGTLGKVEAASPEGSGTADPLPSPGTIPEKKALLDGLPVRAQMLHPEFVYLTAFFAVNSFTLRFYMGAVREQLMQGVISVDGSSSGGGADVITNGNTEEVDTLVATQSVQQKERSKMMLALH
jgi:MFS family permease